MPQNEGGGERIHPSKDLEKYIKTEEVWLSTMNCSQLFIIMKNHYGLLSMDYVRKLDWT